MKRRVQLPAFGICLFLASCVLAAETQPDLVIRGGKIVNGTGNPWFIGDLAITGDRISAIGTVASRGKREIDARGLVIAPGFIDMHSHSDWVLLEDVEWISRERERRLNLRELWAEIAGNDPRFRTIPSAF